MYPAFSVIFFTTASGAGFGLCAWLGALALFNALPTRGASLLSLSIGAALAALGLVASLGHLGKPQRAWRAFSQWQTSWLSREGVASVGCFVPILALWLLLWRADVPLPDEGYGVWATPGIQLCGAALLLLSLACVICTAMIYHSLKPVPAWRHPLVVPVYLVFALYTGGLLLAAVLGMRGGILPFMATGDSLPGAAGLAAIGGAALLWRMKRQTWRAVDADILHVTRNSALGIEEGRSIHVFERPHTEANYLLKEMGYVLARKHARRLRAIAVVLFALLPGLLAVPVWLHPQFDPGVWMLGAAVIALLGTAVERWLFFAEAKHLVTLYY